MSYFPIQVLSLSSLFKPLLIIEDSDEDFTALTRMMNKANLDNPIYRCEDGEEALDFWYHQGEYEDKSLAPRPSLIVLDLNLPGTDGREVLAELKSDRLFTSNSCSDFFYFL